MRHALVLTGLLFLTPLPVEAATGSLFHLFYDESANAVSTADISSDMANFVIREMEHWQKNGIRLTPDDIRLANQEVLWDAGGGGLCQNKVSMDDVPYDFVQGGSGLPSCTQLLTDIQQLVGSEREADQLGTDLVTIANGAELSIADEPHRPVNMAELAMVVRRVWAGTGASVVPWDGRAADQVKALQDHLTALDQRDLAKAILRFHHGYFRDEREADPRFSGVADEIGTDLRAIADVFKIRGDNPRALGIFSVPPLTTPNVGLWVRGDDIGLQWIYPAESTRLSYEEAGEYPRLHLQGDILAYPFSYSRASYPAPIGVSSPLCNRMMGRLGYLCRPLLEPATNCENSGDSNAITLVRCDEESSRTESGPDICADFSQLFDDDGTPLQDPDNPGEINPALTPADIEQICSPERQVLYKDDIESHACFIGFCLKQSLSGHSLLPGRNTTLVGETTSPYAACIRTDPQLGLFTELVSESPYSLPEYQGVILVKDFDRSYCGVTGDAPLPLGGLCRFDEAKQVAFPNYMSIFQQIQSGKEVSGIAYRQGVINSLAAAIGQRVALDQAGEVHRKTFAKLANFINQIASLILELRRAPLTKTACPWTGPFTTTTP